jgi:hypothetical protein
MTAVSAVADSNKPRARARLARRPGDSVKKFEDVLKVRLASFSFSLHSFERKPPCRLLSCSKISEKIPFFTHPAHPLPALADSKASLHGSAAFSLLNRHERHRLSCLGTKPSSQYTVYRTAVQSGVIKLHHRKLQLRAHIAPCTDRISHRCPFAATRQIRRTRSNPGRSDPPNNTSDGLLVKAKRLSFDPIGSSFVPVFLDIRHFTCYGTKPVPPCIGQLVPSTAALITPLRSPYDTYDVSIARVFKDRPKKMR